MSQTSPSDVDALLGGDDEAPESAAGHPETLGESSAERSMNPEDTGESAPIQGKEVQTGRASSQAPSPGKADPRGVPWVDFVPEYTHKRPKELDEGMAEHLSNMNDYLADKEKLKLAFHTEKIHTAYQSLWVRDANRIFRALIRLKIRRMNYQKRNE